MTTATFKAGKTYIGKENNHYSRFEFHVVKIEGNQITVNLDKTMENFTLELKKNIEGEYCKLNKIVIRAKDLV